MCGRYDLDDLPGERVLLGDLGVSGDLVEHINIAPGGIGQIVYETVAGRQLEEAYWSLLIEPKPGDGGYRPSPKYSTFNAQSRRLNASPLWRGRYPRQRAIVPASAFYEWTGDRGHKTCHRIRPTDGPIAFGGLYEHWEFDDDLITSFTIITLPPHPRFLHIHEKSFPLMLTEADFDLWLDPHFHDINAFNYLMATHIPTDIEVMTVKAPGRILPTASLEIIRAD